MGAPNYTEALRFLKEAECALDQADSCMERDIKTRVTLCSAHCYASASDIRKQVEGLIKELNGWIDYDARHATCFLQGSPDGETPQAEKELAGKRLEAGEPQEGENVG